MALYIIIMELLAKHCVPPAGKLVWRHLSLCRAYSFIKYRYKTFRDFYTAIMIIPFLDDTLQNLAD